MYGIIHNGPVEALTLIARWFKPCYNYLIYNGLKFIDDLI